MCIKPHAIRSDDAHNTGAAVPNRHAGQRSYTMKAQPDARLLECLQLTMEGIKMTEALSLKGKKGLVVGIANEHSIA